MSKNPLIQIYQWNDGSEVFLEEKRSDLYLDYRFQICLQGRKPFSIQIQGNTYSHQTYFELVYDGETFPISRYSPQDLDQRKKFLGFVFDLMGKDHLLKRELVWAHEETHSKTYVDLGPRGPTIIHDDGWKDRYRKGAGSLIYEHRIDLHKGWRGGWESEVNLDPGSPMAFVQKPPRRIWYTEFEREFCSPERDSEEEAIDDALRAYPIIPASGLEEWLQNNLERGTWVKPTPEEVQLWEILDEKLPFFWSYEDLKSWLEG